MTPGPHADGLLDAVWPVSYEAESGRRLREAEFARAAAEAERQRFRRLFLQAPAQVVLLRGPDHVIELANPPALAIWGRTEEDVQGKPILEALPEVRDQGIKELLDGVFTTGKPHHGSELKVQLDRHGNGMLEDVYFTFVYEPMRDETGTVDGVMVLAFIVTDQVIARQKALESEEWLAAVFHSTAVGVAVLTLDAKFVQVNEAFCRIVGYSPDELVAGLDCASLTHPDDCPAMNEKIGALLAGRIPTFVIEKRYRRKDGTLIWVQNSVSLARDAAGQPRHLVALCQDITERKRTDKALQASEAALRQKQEQLEIALAASDTGTFRWDPVTGAYLTFDANLKRLFGFAPSDTVRVTEDKLARVHPDDVEALREAIQRRRKRANFEVDYRVVLPDGRVRWLHDRGKMEYDGAGQPTYLVGACTDITQRKESEIAAREAAERFRFLAEMIPQKVFTATPTGAVDYFNPQWTAYTGLPFNQIRDWGWTQFIHPDDVGENVRVWQNSIETGEPFQFEHRFRRGDGVYRWHLSRALPMRDEEGRIVKWFGANTDIDDQKRALERKDEFVSIAAHELKSPVTALKGQIQLLHRRLQRRGETNAVAQLAKLDIQLDRLTRLIGELLDVSRLQTGQLPLHFESVDVDALVAEVVEAAQLTSPRHRIVVNGLADRQLWGDRERIGQVLMNLLSNAIKYSPEADRILVHVEANEREIVLGVQDFGIGVAPEERDKIFDRFYRVADSPLGAVTGWGLGLYIAAEVVRRHGGRIGVESEQGLGATFWVHLPAKSAGSIGSTGSRTTA